MWTKIDADRWTYGPQPDGTRNYLLRSGTLLLELHVDIPHGTLHTYQAAVEVDDAAPLIGSSWVSSTVHPELGGADEAAAWAALTEAVG